MSEYSLYETQTPDLNEYSGGIRQLIFYPTPETPGRCLSFSAEDVPTPADVFNGACNTSTGIGPLLSRAGVSLEYKTIWSQKTTRFNFTHPDVFDSRLQAIAIAQPDFKPPRFEAFEGEHYSFEELASYLGRGVVPLATRGYATVHDYEVRVPVFTAMAPELFGALCEQSQNIQPSQRSEWMKQTDALTQLGSFGRLLASSSRSSFRETIINWLEEHTSFSTQDAMRLGYQSENYRREVITPVVQSLR